VLLLDASSAAPDPPLSATENRGVAGSIPALPYM
jgi:hypothetical protein